MEFLTEELRWDTGAFVFPVVVSANLGQTWFFIVSSVRTAGVSDDDEESI